MPSRPLNIRMDEGFRAEIEAAARRAGTNVSNYLRDAARARMDRRDALVAGPDEQFRVITDDEAALLDGITNGLTKKMVGNLAKRPDTLELLSNFACAIGIDECDDELIHAAEFAVNSTQLAAENRIRAARRAARRAAKTER